MRLFFAIIIALSSAFAFRGGAEFSFLNKNHDFTDTVEGTILTHDYSFTNTGTAPLVITGYNVACSCTSIVFPEKPIMPGQKGEISLRFDTKGKTGYQSRKIEILSNAVNKVKLSFRVFVLPETTSSN